MARPAGGYRLKDGTQAVGTTTVLSRWKESGGLLQWAWRRGKEYPDEPLYQARDEAGDVGSYVHALIEADIDHSDPPEPPKGFTDRQMDQAQQAFSSFVEWTQLNRMTIVRKEMPLVCEHHRYGGTPDAWAMLGPNLAMLDWKSSKGLYYDYTIQLAAYRHLHEDHFPAEKIAGIHIIRFSKVGCDFTHRYFRADHPALELAWRQFQIMREAYDLDKELKEDRSMNAYHFLKENMCAGEGYEPAWKVGETRTIKQPKRIKLCAYGYHASPTLWDALQNAPGPMACLVVVSEPVAKDETKSVHVSRTLIKAVNIERELRLLAADYAEHVLYIFEREQPDDKRPHKAIQAARDFADGKIDHKQLAAAGAAAWDAAAGTAAGVAAGDAAARAAVWAAAGVAAWDAAARAAAGDAAAGVAAWAATAGAAAGDAAARAAVWAAAARAAAARAAAAGVAAARAAETQWQRDHFEEVVEEIFTRK